MVTMISEMELRSALHELNNALTIIVSSADLLMLDIEPDDPAHQDVGAIIAACERGRLIVEGIREKAMS